MGAVELFTATDRAAAGPGPSRGAGASQPTSRHGAAVATGPADPLAGDEPRELLCLLLRNLALHKANKGRLVSTTGVLGFLLAHLTPRGPGVVGGGGGDGAAVRVAAAASAALWAILHHCERAKPNLRALGADRPVALALSRLERAGTGAGPSAARCQHHLLMVRLLLAK